MCCDKAIEDSAKAVHGLHWDCFISEFNTESESDFIDLVERKSQSAPPSVENTVFDRFNSTFFHGKFRKYSARLCQKNYILKMEQTEFPELPAVEYVSNRIARLLGLQVPDHHLILYKNQTLTFVTRNFMDQFSAATQDHVYKFLKPEDTFSCEVIIRIIKQETRRLSEVHRFVELCLFDALIGNNDRHGRNLAFITRSASVRILAPFYDNPSYVGIADKIMLGADLQPRGFIHCSNTQEPLILDYVAEFRNHQLENVVARFKQRILARKRDIFELIGKARVLSMARRNALIKLIEKRIHEIENE
jgi:hypothetical protein